MLPKCNISARSTDIFRQCPTSGEVYWRDTYSAEHQSGSKKKATETYSMSLDSSDTIDAIGIDEKSGEMILAVLDDWP